MKKKRKDFKSSRNKSGTPVIPKKFLSKKEQLRADRAIEDRGLWFRHLLRSPVSR